MPAYSNNTETIDTGEFIKIITGQQTDYIYGYALAPSMAQFNESEGIRQSVQRNEQARYYPVKVPAFWTVDMWNYRYNGYVPRNSYPDFSKPMVTVISNPVRYHRSLKEFDTAGNYVDVPPLLREINVAHCRFNYNLQLDGFRSIEGISFNDTQILNQLEQNQDTVNYSLNIINSKIKFFRFINCHFDKQVTDCNLKIENTESDELIVENCNVNKLCIGNETNIKKIRFVNSKFKEITIKTNNSVDMEVDSCQIETAIIIDSPIASLLIKDKNNEDSVFDSFDNLKYTIGDLKISHRKQVDASQIQITCVNIKSVEFTGLHSGDVILANVQCQTLFFKDFTNTGQIRLNAVNYLEHLSFNYAFLGKIILIRNLFAESKSVLFKDSDISEAVLSNTQFPSDVSLASNPHDAREFYRQLKYVSVKQNNRINELRYEKLEMDAYSNDKLSKKSVGDKIILCTNWLSNDHGQSWGRALGLLLCFSMLFFIIIKACLGYTFYWGLPSWLEIGQYANFVANPIHDFDKLFNTKSTDDYGAARFFDVLAKLSSGYLIFQLLRAFRKYAK